MKHSPFQRKYISLRSDDMIFPKYQRLNWYPPYTWKDRNSVDDDWRFTGTDSVLLTILKLSCKHGNFVITTHKTLLFMFGIFV